MKLYERFSYVNIQTHTQRQFILYFIGQFIIENVCKVSRDILFSSKEFTLEEVKEGDGNLQKKKKKRNSFFLTGVNNFDLTI